MLTKAAKNAVEAANRVGLPQNTISIEAPAGCANAECANRGEPITGGAVRFRGRAVEKLLDGVPQRPWTEFVRCPDEDLADPGRVHVDVFGHLHVCQGLLMGNLWQRPLKEIVADYAPRTHPIIGPLMEGGPAELVRHYDLLHEDTYADACHLCYVARDILRARFPEYLAPNIAYGDLEETTT